MFTRKSVYLKEFWIVYIEYGDSAHATSDNITCIYTHLY